MTDNITEYNRRYEEFLARIADNLRRYLVELLSTEQNIDRISTRAKSPEGFAEKSQRKDPTGTLKYGSPFTEIQDLLGARVVVFYKYDVDRTTETVRRYFQPIEQKDLVPESEWEFGYFGRHFVIPLPRDCVPREVDLSQVPSFFELQIKTLFQHAWSEANHNLGYKSVMILTPDQQRSLAFTAAQAWGADRIFDELVREVR